MWSDKLISIKLEQIKTAIRSNKVLFVNREKNAAALARLGLTVAHVYAILLKLSPEDYYSGPADDKDGSEGVIWVFLKDESGETIYIKLKLFGVNNEYVKVLSFHGEAEND